MHEAFYQLDEFRLIFYASGKVAHNQVWFDCQPAEKTFLIGSKIDSKAGKAHKILWQ